MKTLVVKAFTAAGQPLGVVNQCAVSPFTKKINDGLGECMLTLNADFGDVSPFAVLGNVIEISSYGSAVINEAAKRIYIGYVSKVDRKLTAAAGTVTLTLLGFVTLLGLDVYRSGTTTSIQHTGVNAGAVFADIVDKYRANTSLPRFYYEDKSSIDTTDGPSLTYLFEQRTYREAMDIVRRYASSGHYYYLGADGIAKFRTPAATPKHTFVLGRHFSEIALTESLEEVRTQMLLWNGVPSGGTKIYKKYTDAVGNGKYGARVERAYDNGVTVEATANYQATRFLADRSVPSVKLTCTIFSLDAGQSRPAISPLAAKQLGYAIEDIEPGDTCRFLGFEQGAADILRDNMLITDINYQWDKVTLTIDISRSGLYDWQVATEQAIARLSGSGTPTAYTT